MLICDVPFKLCVDLIELSSFAIINVLLRERGMVGLLKYILAVV